MAEAYDPAHRARIATRDPRLLQAVIFDLDGLMLDTERIARDAWQAAAREVEREIDDALFAQFVGKRDPDCMEMLRAQWGPFDLEAFRQAIQAHWDARIARAGLPVKDGLGELLEHLEALAWPKAVATSSRRPSALRKLGDLAARFDALVTGDEVAQGKPAPDIFLLAARRLRVPPAACLVLEDSPAGVAAARAAGMPVIMVPDLVPAGDDVEHVCASLHEVLAWLTVSR